MKTPIVNYESTLGATGRTLCARSNKAMLPTRKRAADCQGVRQRPLRGEAALKGGNGPEGRVSGRSLAGSKKLAVCLFSGLDLGKFGERIVATVIKF